MEAIFAVLTSGVLPTSVVTAVLILAIVVTSGLKVKTRVPSRAAFDMAINAKNALPSSRTPKMTATRNGSIKANSITP